MGTPVLAGLAKVSVVLFMYVRCPQLVSPSVRVSSRPGLHLFTYHKHLSQRRVVYFGYVNEVTISLSSQCRIVSSTPRAAL